MWINTVAPKNIKKLQRTFTMVATFCMVSGVTTQGLQVLIFKEKTICNIPGGQPLEDFYFDTFVDNGV